MLRALWNIFNAFAEPREELLEAAADQAAQSASGPAPLANGAAAALTAIPIHSPSFKNVAPAYAVASSYIQECLKFQFVLVSY